MRWLRMLTGTRNPQRPGGAGGMLLVMLALAGLLRQAPPAERPVKR